jgi:hypothetical protein
MLEAAERADQMLDEGDMAGAETWHRILKLSNGYRRRRRQRARRCTDRKRLAVLAALSCWTKVQYSVPLWGGIR